MTAWAHADAWRSWLEYTAMRRHMLAIARLLRTRAARPPPPNGMRDWWAFYVAWQRDALLARRWMQAAMSGVSRR